jgi:PTS hybrid protein
MSAVAPGAYARSMVLTDPAGLHARPAAELAKLAQAMPARATANGADARSILALMSLGLARGATLEIAASDDEAGRTTVDALAQLVLSEFARSDA